MASEHLRKAKELYGNGEYKIATNSLYANTKENTATAEPAPNGQNLAGLLTTRVESKKIEANPQQPQTLNIQQANPPQIVTIDSYESLLKNFIRNETGEIMQHLANIQGKTGESLNDPGVLNQAIKSAGEVKSIPAPLYNISDLRGTA